MLYLIVGQMVGQIARFDQTEQNDPFFVYIEL